MLRILQHGSRGFAATRAAGGSREMFSGCGTQPTPNPEHIPASPSSSRCLTPQLLHIEPLFPHTPPAADTFPLAAPSPSRSYCHFSSFFGYVSLRTIFQGKEKGFITFSSPLPASCRSRFPHYPSPYPLRAKPAPLPSASSPAGGAGSSPASFFQITRQLSNIAGEGRSVDF